jgi:hypothetical protein
VTRLQAGIRGLDSRQGQVFFSLRHRVQDKSGAHPVSYPMGTSCSFIGVKWTGREAPPTDEVKNAWSYISTPPYVFMAWYLVQQRDNFT